MSDEEKQAKRPPIPKGNRILVCGGRDYVNEESVCRALGMLHQARRADYPDKDTFPLVGPIEVIVHGACGWDRDVPSTWSADALRGADGLADRWAWRHNVGRDPHPARWKKHGRSAGFIRNDEMLSGRTIHAVVAFPGGAGTQGTIALAVGKSIPVWRILQDPTRFSFECLGKWILPRNRIRIEPEGDGA